MIRLNSAISRQPFALHLPHFADAASNAAGIGKYDMQLTLSSIISSRTPPSIVPTCISLAATPDSETQLGHLFVFAPARLTDATMAQMVAALRGTASFSCVALRLRLHHLAPACRDLVSFSLEVNGHPSTG
ncbi:uncharacterized protein TRIVIDRAFT_211118 [Trichoderma virens Gv29-8]|uniref:Uncharacterized protein n=1 Tax=Hypocrea virens (strain Gv29-8 / FGSC 10586) TaxID=413071 RepID=G9NCV8_HYPVG|nr:uncharacterized protein TRIVIDRAFT_211118 [Trichoderma virens Gv29-8]EHK15530.1 hypothetical protein TRIVIDRAFT_211118 [Trichoderma virens Gv29-8]